MSKYWLLKAHPSYKGFLERYQQQFKERGYSLTYKELSKITLHLTRYSDVRKLKDNQLKNLVCKAKSKRGII